MSGVSGISGGSGAGKVPPESNNDDRKSVGNLGGHEVSSSGSSQEATSSSSSIQERAQSLLDSNFQVRSPEEQRRLESQRSEKTQNPGLLSRIWRVVTGFFRRSSRTKSLDISGPTVPGYQKYGQRLPGVGEFRMRLVRVSSGDQTFEEVSETEGEVSADDVFLEAETTHSVSSGSESSKVSKREKLAAFGNKISGLFSKSWSKANEPAGPLDPQHLISAEELRTMADSYTRLAGMTDDSTEKEQMLRLADDCRRRAESLDPSSSRSTSTVQGREISGLSSISVDHCSDEQLVEVVREGEDAERTLEGIEGDIAVVLESVDRLSSQTKEDSTLSPTMRDRLVNALRRLGASIRSMLIVIRTVILGLCRRMRRGLMALGESVTRCCRHNRDQRVYEEVQLPGREDREIPDDLRNRIWNILQEEGNNAPLSIPDNIVDQWRSGDPSSVVVDLSVTDVGEGYSVINRGNRATNELYEDMSSSSSEGSNGEVYELMQSISPDIAGPHQSSEPPSIDSGVTNDYVLDPESIPSWSLALRPLPPRPTQSVENVYEELKTEPLYLDVLPQTSSSESNVVPSPFALGVTPGYGHASRAAVLAQALEARERVVRFADQVEIVMFDPNDPPSAIRSTIDGSDSGSITPETWVSRMRKAFGNFLFRTARK